MQEHTPLTWMQQWASALQWPVIVISAFFAGRYVKGLETRVLNAERRLKDVIERHLPHVHRALAEINGKINTITALLTKGSR